MNKADLINKITEILGVAKPKDELAFEIFLEKISERLQLDEALRMPGVGIFQLKEEPFTGVKKTFPGVDTESKTELMFAPFVKDSEALYLTFDVKKRKTNPLEFSDDIFSIGVEKPVVPITENLNDSLSANSSYILLRKSIGDLIDKLLDKSDHLENFDIWDDFINSGENSEYEVFEEIVLDEKFSDLEEQQESEEQQIEEEAVAEPESVEDDFPELDALDALEEFENDIADEEVTDAELPEEEAPEPIEEVPEESEVEAKEEESEIESEIDNIEAAADELLENFDLSEDDILTDDLQEESSDDPLDEFDIPESTDDQDLELSDSEIDQLNDLIKEEDLAEESGEETPSEELKEDDFELSEDELKEILENEENSEEDWDWGDELKQEIVDQDEDDIDGDVNIEDQIEESSDDLFDQLEESLKDEIDDSEEGAEAEEDLHNLEEELSDEEKSEDETTEEKSEEETPSEEEPVKEKEDKLDSLLQKKDVKQSFMAKIKQKMGIFFWVLVAVFVLSTAGGVYYFMFMTPQEIDLSDPLLDEYGLSVADTVQQDSTKDLAHKDSVKTEKKDTLKEDSQKKIAKDSHKKDDTKKTPENKSHKKTDVRKDTHKKQNTEIKTPVKKNTEQKSGKDNKKKTAPVKTGKLKFVDNPKETKIGKTQVYKSGNKYSVQISSWRKKSQAEKEAQKLMRKGHNVFIVKVFLKSLGGTWYRVRVGDFNSLQEAKNFDKIKR